MSLWHVNCFEQKQSRPKRFRKKSWPFPELPKNFQIKGLFLDQSYHQRSLQRYGLGWWGKLQAGPKDQYSIVSAWLFQIVAFSSSCQLPTSPLQSQTTAPNILFCLQLKMVFKVRTQAIFVNYSVFLALTQLSMLLNFHLIFLLLICLISI